MTRASGFTSVMAARRSPPDALDFFPTPPWATRAGVELICELDERAAASNVGVSEPACGAGHMALVLQEHFGDVAASDVFDYGWGAETADFLADDWASPYLDWIVTNPPFKVGARFAELAIRRARRGVALLCRSAFAEGERRHRNLFAPFPPAVIAQFSERVPMVEGRWDPEAGTATSYAWFIWLTGERNSTHTQFRWIAPGTRGRLWRSDDVRRFAPELDSGPLFGSME